MTPLRRGAVVLVPFPFTDLSAVKRRPALVISSDEYNAATGDVIIAQITSRVNSPRRPGDHQLKRWKDAGLLVPSLVRARMTTLHSSIVVKPLGAMAPEEMSEVGSSVGGVLGLS